MYGCTGLELLGFSWAVLACVAIPITGNYWNHLELPGCAPQCMAALMCRFPPFHTFYFHALGSVGMRCPAPYWWILLEPPGTPRILLDVPHPEYLKCMVALLCSSPPLHTFYSHALGCVGMRCHSSYYWKLLEPPGTPRILLDVPPRVPEMYGCTDVQVPPLSYILFPWNLGSVGMRCPAPYWWILLEPPGTPRILLDVPHPEYLKCMVALLCSSPPFIHFIPMLWAVLACVAILPTIGKYWNHLEPS